MRDGNVGEDTAMKLTGSGGRIGAGIFLLGMIGVVLLSGGPRAAPAGDDRDTSAVFYVS